MNAKLSNIDPIKRESMATQVARRLVEYIISGEIEPGARMPSERQLAEAFGVGRSAMREALKSLSLIGLIDVRQGDGTYLKRADAALLPQIIEWGLLIGEQRTMDLVEARQHIEIDIAELAALRRTDDDLADLERIIQRMERSSNDYTAFVEADVAFHLRLAEAARNSVLRDIHSSIQALLRAWIGRVISAADSTLPSFREHLPILEAVRRGDPERAKRAMEAHMVSAAGRLAITLRQEELRLAETRRARTDNESPGVQP
ncbi:MAG: GntR family transcriptional regulator, transcriptional repressor for pyruvate dehydrogenase complex [Thermomicrobiales bacterium]|nr:GntR family transcriptional regulator, transcriptional repressor for pyruvate dehydrogenase complex [Thermomicrobiales bacterium]